MTTEERRNNCERLALLCGWFVNVGSGTGVPPNCLTFMPMPLPDFYAEDSGTWRERAEASLLKRMRETCSSRPLILLSLGSAGFDVEIRTGGYELDIYIDEAFETLYEAKVAALIAALDTLEKEGLGIPDEVKT